MKHFYIIVFLSFISFLCGCGNNSSLTNHNDTTITSANYTSEESFPWSVTHSATDFRFEKSKITDSRIIGCYFSNEGLNLCVQDKSTLSVVNQYILSDINNVVNFSINDKDEICLLSGFEDNYSLWQIDSLGSVHRIDDITLENQGLLLQIKSFFSDNSSHYYIHTQMTVPENEINPESTSNLYVDLDRIYVKDSSMNTLYYESIPITDSSCLIALLFDTASNPIILAEDERGSYIQHLDHLDSSENAKIRVETIDYEMIHRLRSSEIISYNNNKICYLFDGYLYLYDVFVGSNEPLVGIESCGINETNILCMYQSGNTYEFINDYPITGKSELSVLSNKPSNKTILTLGTTGITPDMKDLVASFNHSQEDILINTLLYPEIETTELTNNQLYYDIIQGKAPDLIYISGIDYDILANMGVFEDLYPYINSDSSCNKNIFIPSALKGMETGNHLYFFSPSFNIITMWGGKSLVGTRYGLSSNELISLLNNAGGSINSIYGIGGGDETPLRSLCTMTMSDYIDWENNTSSFNSSDFHELLSFVKEYEVPYYESYYEAFRNKTFLLSYGIMSSVNDYAFQSKLYGEPIAFVGCPSSKSTGSSFSFISPYAIYAKSAHKEEAWNFINYLIQFGYGNNSVGFPVRQDLFENEMNRAMEVSFTTENGDTTQDIIASYSENGNVLFTVNSISQTDVDEIRNLISRTNTRFSYINSLQNIIDEEADAFFQNQKSAEEVSSIIQNRIQVFLNEHQ